MLSTRHSVEPEPFSLYLNFMKDRSHTHDVSSVRAHLLQMLTPSRVCSHSVRYCIPL